jgi:membrane fusion protein, copper/silver efflux system
MKTKTLIICIVFAAFVMTFSGCGSQDKKNATTEKTTTDTTATAKTTYTCSMDTVVKSDKPGKCPICGMDLVKIETLK